MSELKQQASPFDGLIPVMEDPLFIDAAINSILLLINIFIKFYHFFLVVLTSLNVLLKLYNLLSNQVHAGMRNLPSPNTATLVCAHPSTLSLFTFLLFCFSLSKCLFQHLGSHCRIVELRM